MKTIKHTYTYDANGNQLSEYKRGNGTGSAKEDYHYTYDVLDRVTSAHENYGNVTRGYEYDTLSNLVYETQSGGNKFTDRQYNILNQMVYMTQDKSGKEYMTYEYDNRGNLLNAEYHKGKDNPNKGKGNGSDKGNNQNNNGNKEGLANASYVYDETNKMVQGTNGKGEISLYTRDGLGNLIGNEWIVEKNAYGYHGFDKIEPSVPSALKKHEVVKKSYVLDYTSYLKNVLLEEEEQGLTYRYGYGFEEHKLSVKVSPIEQAAGTIQENGAVKLYYHTDYLGTTDYLTSDKTGKVTSWTMYNEWGEITHNAVLKCGVRELDMVKNYTGYDYDAVLDLYYAKNRMYDATNHRFTQLDPIKDGDNWYAYVGNNPVNWIDPLGLAYYAIIRNASGNIIGGGSLGDTTFANSGYFHAREVTALLNNSGRFSASTSYDDKSRDVTLRIWDYSKTKGYQDKSIHVNMGMLSGKTAAGLTSDNRYTSVYFKSYKCWWSGTKSYVNLQSLMSYLGLTVDVYNQDIGKITNAVEFLDSTKQYMTQSMNQVVLGNYTNDITWLGTGGQVLAGLSGFDLPADIRDIAYDLQNWEWSLSHAGQLAIDSIGLLPLVGVLKYGDETIALLKNGDEISTIFSKGKLTHILDGHHLQTFLKQVPYLSDEKLAGVLVKKSFFNPTWSTQEIADAASEAYAKAIKDGIKNNTKSYLINGEVITVSIKNGVLDTAYGAYKYTAEELRRLAGQ